MDVRADEPVVGAEGGAGGGGGGGGWEYFLFAAGTV